MSTPKTPPERSEAPATEVAVVRFMVGLAALGLMPVLGAGDVLIGLTLRCHLGSYWTRDQHQPVRRRPQQQVAEKERP